MRTYSTIVLEEDTVHAGHVAQLRALADTLTRLIETIAPTTEDV